MNRKSETDHNVNSRPQEETLATPELPHEETLSRRTVFSAFAGALGATALSGPVRGPAEPVGIGSSSKWADTMADLRALLAPTKAIIVHLLGYHTPSDGGGGVFRWDALSTLSDDGGLTIIPKGSKTPGRWRRVTSGPVNVRWFGASPDASSSENSASIQKAINSLPGSGGTVLFPAGAYRVADTIRVLRNNVALIGDGVDATTLLADVTLMAVVRFGEAATHDMAINCSIERMSIDRQTGTIPVGSVGILWELFAYGYERLTRVNRHYYGRKITGIGPPNRISIQYSLYEPYSSNATRAHMCIEHAAGIKVIGGEFGRNGGEEFNCAGMIEITGLANGVIFVGSDFIPRGPAIAPADKPAVIMINGVTIPTGVYRFTDCNAENTSVGFSSDAATPQISDIHVVGGRWSMDTTMFNFHPNTKVAAMWLTGVAMGTTVILVNTLWLVMSGSTMGSAGFHGGPEADMTITGNRFQGSVLLDGAFRALVFTGNVHNGLTNSSSGNTLVTNNLQSNI
jgi:Pectate lyase superfamily protein